MSPVDLSLEEAAIAGIANLATRDLPRAQNAMDTEKVAAHDFADANLRAVWPVVEAMVRDSRIPDLYAVKARLPAVPHALLNRVLVEGQPKGSTAEKLRMVREGGQRRRAGKALETVQAMLSVSSEPLAKVALEARKALEALETQTAGVGTLDAEVMALVDHLEEVSRGERPPVLETGIHALDAVIGGLSNTLTIIGALPAVGKSALLAGMVRNLAARGVPVGFFSLEDERRWIPARLVSEASGIPLFVLLTRRLSKHQQEDLYASMPKVHADMAKVVVDDRPGLTAADIVASAREMLARHRVKALFVDHLGEVKVKSFERHDLEILSVLTELRSLAKTYRVPVVVACHLKRRDGLLQHDEPRLTDFAFSAAVERTARVALALSRPKPDSEGQQQDTLRVHVLKQTNGPGGVFVDLRVNVSSATVSNVDLANTRKAMDRLLAASGGSHGD